MTTYRIRGWPEHFENNRTAELKNLTWVRMPVKLDGDGYTELLDHPQGAAHYGAWVACVLVAARCDPRGTLLRDGGRPHDAASLSRITRIPNKTLTDALERFVQIGWMDAEGPPLTLPSEEKKDKTRGDNDRAAQAPAAFPQQGAMFPQEPATLTQEVVAKSLAKKLGSNLNPCRKQVAALVGAGWTLDKITFAVEDHGAPGLAPWDWTKTVTGAGSRNGQIDYAKVGRDLEGRIG